MIKILIIIIIIGLLYTINFECIIKENFNDDKTYTLPKVIYGFWDDLDSNEVIKSHIKNWRKKISKDWKIIILNKDNVYKYVDAKFINRYGGGQIDSTRFSDFLRLYLLINNGGCWLDASIFITNGSFLDKYYNEMLDKKMDGCFYEYKELTLDPIQPHIDNWFMMAPKNSQILKDLYSEFDKAYEMNFLKYKRSILMNSGILLDKTIGYGDSTYLLQHAIFHYLLKNNTYNIILKDASESMYKIQQTFLWNHKELMNFIINNTDWKNFYGIKLTKTNRNEIKDIKKYIKMVDNL